MIQITESAARVIARQLSRTRQESGGLRIAVKAGGCSGYAYTFAFDGASRPTDHVFEGPGGVKVFVDPRSLALLDGTVLDFDDQNLMATNFTLSNPHAKSTCGCGESFSA
jgi:iron-sulfur cluster assembly protein